jgi:hypothetical protein
MPRESQAPHNAPSAPKKSGLLDSAGQENESQSEAPRKMKLSSLINFKMRVTLQEREFAARAMLFSAC